MQSPNIPPCSVLERYAGVRVLVLGASGFIGRWVARLLTQAGADLYLPTRDCSAARKTFLEYGVDGDVFNLDLEDSHLLRRAIREINPTVTFNLAAYGVSRYEQVRQTAYEINSRLPRVVCSAVADTAPVNGWHGQRFVHAGTAMEYGAISGDLREDSPARPTTLYGRSKLDGTTRVASFCERTNFPAVIARLFAVYGPGEAANRLLPTLIHSSRHEDVIELTAGLHKRDFTYVEDVAEAILRLGASTCRPGEIVNVASGTLTSIRSFTEIAAQCLGIASPRLRFGVLETRPEEMQHNPVNVQSLRRITGCQLNDDLKEGVLKTLRFASKHIAIHATARASQKV